PAATSSTQRTAPRAGCRASVGVKTPTLGPAPGSPLDAVRHPGHSAAPPATPTGDHTYAAHMRPLHRGGMRRLARRRDGWSRMRRLGRLAAALGSLALLAVGAGQDGGGPGWGREALGRLGEAGVELGFPDGSFLGEDAVTGYQAAVLIDRLLARADAGTGCTDAMAGLPDPGFSFDDVPPDHWAAGAAARVAALGVREAFPEGRLGGDEFLTGFQTAALMAAAVEVVGAKLESGE